MSGIASILRDIQVTLALHFITITDHELTVNLILDAYSERRSRGWN